LLWVLPDAPPKVISAVYRQLSQETHPDVTGGSSEATEKQKMLNVAHSLLQNDTKRAEYDKQQEAAFPMAPRTMSEARRRLAAARSTIRSLEDELDVERQNTTAHWDADLRAQFMDLFQAQLPGMRDLAKQQAWEEISEFVDHELMKRDATNKDLTERLAAAEGQLSAGRRRSVSEDHGPARPLLQGALALALVASIIFWLLQTLVLSGAVWQFAPTATMWPEWLRQPWPAILPLAMTLLLTVAGYFSIARETLWLLAGPVLAGATIWAVWSGAWTSYLWAGASGQITMYLMAYLACSCLGWLLRAV
jgi:hypothetical protein